MRRGRTMDQVVCEICGSGCDHDVMVNCPRCNGYQHRYCLPVVTPEIPDGWHCDECQKKANVDPNPNRGGQTAMLDNNHKNPVYQIGLKTSKKFENAKVRFISCEEAALLNNKERPPYGGSNFAARHTYSQIRPASPPNVRQSPSKRDTRVTQGDASPVRPASPLSVRQSPSKMDTRVTQGDASQVCPASPLSVKQSSIKSDTRVTQMYTRQIRPASPPNVRQSPSKRNSQVSQVNASQVRPASPPSVKQSPIKSGPGIRQVYAMKRCPVASQNQVKIEDINMEQKEQSGAAIPILLPSSTSREAKGKIDSQIQDEHREKKVVSADKSKTNSKIQDLPREKNAFDGPDIDIGRGSETSLHNAICMPLVINSSVEYARRPAPESCWTGSFVVDGENDNFFEYKAFFPSKVSQKVQNIVKRIPNNLKLEVLAQMDDWPDFFETSRPVYEDIGLFLFSNEPDRHEKRHPDILETYCKFVMRTYIDNVKLLLYSSEVLPPDSQWIDGENYLWGVFVNKRKSRRKRLCSVAA